MARQTEVAVSGHEFLMALAAIVGWKQGRRVEIEELDGFSLIDRTNPFGTETYACVLATDIEQYEFEIQLALDYELPEAVHNKPVEVVAQLERPAPVQVPESQPLTASQHLANLRRLVAG